MWRDMRIVLFENETLWTKREAVGRRAASKYAVSGPKRIRTCLVSQEEPERIEPSPNVTEWCKPVHINIPIQSAKLGKM